jgi:RNA polymerase sigma factor (sigma-70 family)
MDPTEPLLRHIRRVTDSGVDDASLLERFVQMRDGSAFAALVARHGPMVLGVCRRVLGELHIAEDAFQATFLVLARQASRLRHHGSLAAWLHITARQLALKSRRAEARRHEREWKRPFPLDAQPGPLDELTARELLVALDEEIQRLPELYRIPLILCYLEERTQEETARLLGWTPGSVKGRLERGRKMLHKRLSRRGLALSATLLATQVSRCALSSESLHLQGATLRAVMSFTSGDSSRITASVIALAEKGLHGVAAAKAGTVLALVLIGGLIAGAGTLARQLLGAKQPAPAEKREEAAAEVRHQPNVDRHGDPLPPDALIRIGTIRFRHFHYVTSVAYSPDGKIIASCGMYDGPIILWDSVTGKELRQVEQGPGQFGPPAFSPDSKLLAVLKQGEIHLWDVATGKKVREMEVQPSAPFGGVVFSPDGKLLAVADSRRVVHLFDPRTGADLRKLPRHPEDVGSLAFSPDGKTLAAGGEGKTLCLYDVSAARELRRLRGHEKEVVSVAFSSDSKTLASGGFDGTVRLWDVATGAERWHFTFDTANPWVYVRFVPGGNHILAGSDGSVRLWDADTGKEIRRYPDHYASNACFDVSPDGKVLIMGGDVLAEVATGKRLNQPHYHEGSIHSISFAPDGKTLSCAGEDRTVRLWEVATSKELRRWSLDSRIAANAVYSPDGKTLAADGDGYIHLYDTGTGAEKRFRSTSPNANWGYRLLFSPDGKTLFTAGSEWDMRKSKAIRLWDVSTRKEARPLLGHKERVTDIALAADGKLLVSASEDGTVRLWDVAAAGEIRQLTDQKGWMNAVTLSPDGKWVAATGNDRVVHLWEAATGKEIHRLSQPGVPSFNERLQLSPDGKTLASAKGRTVYLWEVATGKERARLTGHRQTIRALAYSRDGELLASGSDDATVLVWDLYGRRQGALKAAVSKQQLHRLWDDLGGEDAARAYQAMRSLHAHPHETVGWLREQLPPVPTVAAAWIAQRIAELDSDSFPVRESAMRELEKKGEAVESALRKGEENPSSPEVQKRLHRLLKIFDRKTLQVLRGLEVLEHLGTPEAKEVLTILADGAPGARQTLEARTALQRLAQRPAEKH